MSMFASDFMQCPVKFQYLFLYTGRAPDVGYGFKMKAVHILGDELGDNRIVL